MLNALQFQKMADEQRMAFLESLDEKEAQELSYFWPFWAREDQLIPPGDWVYWLPLAGRGWGKTRTGAETVRQWVRSHAYVNLVGATSDDVRDIMVEGESGILAICPPDERPRYIGARRRLEWPNGARSLLFSAEEPERLRGKQHECLWADEIAAWRYPEAWDMAVFGLRLGARPRAILTTTPRPTKLIRDLMSDPLTYSTTGSTYDNLANLAPNFVARILKKYQGTRLGRQELEAQMLLDVPGALWTRSMIEAAFLSNEARPDFLRIVVAIDPAVSTGEGADETGIIVAGLDKKGIAYVLEDASGCHSPLEWARKAVELYRQWQADRVIAEVNNGGELVETTLRVVDANVAYRAVYASRGKARRAEPVSALYEQGKVRHLGAFARLEDQMCEFTSDFDRRRAGYSPDRLDALVWALSDLKLSQNAGSAVMEFYRQMQPESLAEDKTSVRLLGPAGVSTAYGRSGRIYNSDDNQCFDIDADDVDALLAAGFRAR